MYYTVENVKKVESAKELAQILIIFKEEFCKMAIELAAMQGYTIRAHENKVYMCKDDNAHLCTLRGILQFVMEMRTESVKTSIEGGKLPEDIDRFTQIFKEAESSLFNEKMRPIYDGRCYLTFRGDIAGMINLSTLPTLQIIKKGKRYISGSSCRIMYKSSSHGEWPVCVDLYNDDGKYILSSAGAIVGNDFTQADIIEIVKGNRSPLLYPNGYVIMCEYIGLHTNVFVMKVEDRVDIRSSNVAELRDLTEAEYNEFYDWYKQQKWSF